jgi:hypothetical protein
VTRTSPAGAVGAPSTRFRPQAPDVASEVFFSIRALLILFSGSEENAITNVF